jgi:hypothetical protein
MHTKSKNAFKTLAVTGMYHPHMMGRHLTSEGYQKR